MAQQTLIPTTVEPTEIARAEPPRDTSPEAMLMLAIERNVSAESLEKLVMLQERIMRQRAESAFNAAFQDFQSKLTPIFKNRQGHQGTYATLDQIADKISPLLSENGLSYSFDSDLKDNTVTTTCTIHHVDGHARSHTFAAPIDGTAKMNAMQKAASSLTYSRRYALVLALGITFTEHDDDGEGCTPPAPPEQNQSAPKSAPRGERVTKEDCESLWNDWKAQTNGDWQGYVEWASKVAAIDSDQVGKVASWTRQAVEHCRAELARMKR